MQGVRRWIGANPVSLPRKSKKQATSTDEVYKPAPEPKIIDQTSIEGVVERLLSPTVSEAEEIEYQWYIGQYQSLLTTSLGAGAQQDLEKYWASVRIGAGETNGWAEETASEGTYTTYVEETWDMVSESSGKFYEKWIGSAQRKLAEELA
ncbi:hypothetical protein K439DRAFT_1145370 [Ramaria rubella]|nr:hypothetical protein K439DRAFT_1145370 [Ramaria rubella]